MDANSIKQIIDALERNVPGAIDALARAAYVKAWGDIFTTGAVAIFAAVMFYAAYRMFKLYGEHDEEWMGFVTFALSVVAILFSVATMIGVGSIPRSIADIASPKAAAIRQLLGK